MDIESKYASVTEIFEATMPDAQSELKFMSPYELLVAVMLSAQCTDKRVNLTTPALFKRYPDSQSLAKASTEDVYQLIKSISYPNSKAAHLTAMARKLVSDFGGEVPSNLDELTSLPGVGRKTANVVMSIIYDKPVIAVDTHVFRVAHRIGLSNGRTPFEVEQDLEAHIPEQKRAKAHHWLILHGRYICVARNPKCGECQVRDYCDFYCTKS